MMDSSPYSLAPEADVNAIYRISYMWYALISLIICTVIGVIVSFLTG